MYRMHAACMDSCMHMCLDALDLTGYYRELGCLETTEMNVVESLENYLCLIQQSCCEDPSQLLLSCSGSVEREFYPPQWLRR